MFLFNQAFIIIVCCVVYKTRGFLKTEDENKETG